MPKPGFKAITVKKEKYEEFESIFNELKEMDKLPFGVHSFTGYVEYKLKNHLDEKEKLNKLATKIKTVPTKFTTYKPIIKSIRIKN